MSLRNSLESVMDRYENLSLSARLESILDKVGDAEKRKEYGVFLTEDHLSNILAAKVKSFSSIIDPACGSGFLLMACVEQAFKKNKQIEKIAGIDIHEEFAEICKKRIVKEFNVTKNSRVRLNFKAANAMRHLKEISQYDCVVTNPPYVNVNIDEQLTWGGGKIQYAGYFIYKILKSAKKGQHILAILPDVLRSGTRYEKWRKEIEKLAKINSIDVIGRFSDSADVDVFILDITAKKPNTKKVRWIKSSPSQTISEFFDVKVGSVVDYRDPESGKSYPFLDSSNSKPMTVVKSNQIKKKRKFNGGVFKAPFVVVRRTSSPSDKNRIMPTLIRGDKHVAVENHLIVLKPKDNRLSTCQDFVESCKTRKMNNWINRRIRCRHLTVGSIKNIPKSILL